MCKPMADRHQQIRYRRVMSNETWQGDAVGLVEAFRVGDRSPLEELEATYSAIDTSNLNAITYVDRESASEQARTADVSKPFGGVPIGVKSLNEVQGWPNDKASVPLKERVGQVTTTQVERIRRDGGAVLAAQTTSSEFGGINLTRTVLFGANAQPLAAGSHPRGIVRRFCGSRRRRTPSNRDWRRWRGLDSDPRRVHRPGRPENHLRSGPTRAKHPIRESHGHDWVLVPLSARHGAVVRCDQWTRPNRPAEPAQS